MLVDKLRLPLQIHYSTLLTFEQISNKNTCEVKALYREYIACMIAR